MESLEAQCLLVELAEGKLPPPNLWSHRRSGELTCAYRDGEQTFTWMAEDVAEMARRWRESGSGEAPTMIRPYLDAHRRLEELVADASLEPADVVVHDIERREVRAAWKDEKKLIVIDEIGAVEDAVTR